MSKNIYLGLIKLNKLMLGTSKKLTISIGESITYTSTTPISTANVTYDNATYDGTQKVATNIVVTLNNVTLTKDVDYTVINNGGINAGSYTLIIEGMGEYDNSISQTFIISKADPTITAAPTNVNPTYNGTEQYVLTGGTANIPGTFTYSTGTNAGSYTGSWTFTPTDTTNYNTTSGTVTASITKANISPTVSMSGWTYGGTATNPSVSGNSGSGSVTYNYKVNGANDSTYTITKPSNAGTYTVRAQIAETTNYNGATVTNTFTITKANPIITVAPTNANPTYNGTEQYVLTGGTANIPGTFTYSTGTNAGSYTGSWTFTPTYTTNYNTASGTVTASIAKANPSYSAPYKRYIYYNGSAQDLITAGSTSHGTIQYSSDGTSWSTTIPTGTNAGDYTVYWKIIGDANHNDKNSASIAASIGKTNPSYTAPKSKLIAYTGSAQSLITAGSTSHGTIQYSSDDTSWSTTVPTGTNIGDYTIYWRIVGDANYNDIDGSFVSVIVNKKNTSEYVDFGLPSGTIWATGNIISNGSGGYKIGEETDKGFCFSWGNVTPHTSGDGYTFNSSNYNSTPGASISFTSKHDGRDYPANTTYDAARACLGGSWQVPTATQYIELKDNSDRTFIYYNGVSGVLFQKKTDHSVYVFFPSRRDDGASYWFSSLQSSTHGQRFYFWNNIGTHLTSHQRYLDCLVRAVQ